MEVNALKPVDSTINYPLTRKSESAPVVRGDNTGSVDRSASADSGNGTNQSADDPKGKKELSKEQLMQVNDELNHFMSAINSDIQFTVHEKSKQLMVQVVDTKDHKVIKEFPSHEMLDIMANIREYVGALLDKRV